MRRRMCVAVSLIATALLGVGPTVASAAAKPTVLRCGIFMTVGPSPGNNSVEQPPNGGKMYGPSNCPRAGYGRGILASKFNVPESGDWVGTYTQYFRTGSISGKFDLVPQEGGPVSQDFTAENWVGTLKITGGTGTYQGIKSQKGSGVLKCASPDTVHLTCTEKVRI